MTNSPKHIRRCIAALFALGVLAGCGSDSDGGATEPTKAAPAAEQLDDSSDETTPTVADTTADAQEPTTTLAPVVPPDPLPAEGGVTAVALLQWDYVADGGLACIFLEFADATHVYIEAPLPPDFTHSSDGTGEAAVDFEGQTIWTGSSVIVEIDTILRSAELPAGQTLGTDDCGRPIETLAFILSMNPT